MNIYPLGKSLLVSWSVKKSDGTDYDLTGMAVRLFFASGRTRGEATGFATDGNVVNWTFIGADQRLAGNYTLRLAITDADGKVKYVVARDAFRLSDIERTEESRLTLEDVTYSDVEEDICPSTYVISSLIWSRYNTKEFSVAGQDDERSYSIVSSSSVVPRRGDYLAYEHGIFYMGSVAKEDGAYVGTCYRVFPKRRQIKVVLDIVKGGLFYRQGQSFIATVQATIYANDIDVTDDYQDWQLVWTRSSDDAAGDEDWNGQHLKAGTSMDIYGSDIVGDWTDITLTVYSSTNTEEASETIKL